MKLPLWDQSKLSFGVEESIVKEEYSVGYKAAQLSIIAWLSIINTHIFMVF